MSFIKYVFDFIQLISISDIIDIGIVSFIVYHLINWLRQTRAMQLVKGIILLFALMVISDLMNLTVINYVISTLVQVGTFAIVVIFQPELRTLLESMGRSRVGKMIDFTKDKSKDQESGNRICEEIVTAVMNMADTKTGALIVIERETKLGEINTGTKVDADITSQLLENIFVPNTPLHDGAVIIRDEKILSAACFLPLTSNNNVAKELGTRHRAALGVSEVSDAFTIVVSEETGKVSIAVNGSLTRNVGREPLKKALEKIMIKKENDTPLFANFKFWKGAGSDGK